MEEPRSFSLSIASFGFVQVLVRVRTLILVPILARIIGPEGYGVIGAITALVALVTSLVLVGLNTSLTVFVPAAPPERRAREFWSVMQVAIASGVAVFLALAIAYPLVAPALLPSGLPSGLYLVGILTIPLAVAQALLYAQVVNNRKGPAFVRITILVGIAEVGVLWSLAVWRGAAGVLLGTLLILLMQNVLLWRLIARDDPFVRVRRADLPALGRYYRYGAAIAAAGVGAWVIDASDRLVIARSLPLVDLGVYQVAYSLASQVGQLAVPLFAGLMPFLVETVASGQRERTREYLVASQKLLLLVLIPAVALLAVNAGNVLVLVAGSEFAAGEGVIGLVAAGVAIYQLSGIYAYTLHAHRRGGLLLISLGVAGALNLGLTIFLVPRYGIVAAAAATAIAYSAHLLVARAFARRSLGAEVDGVLLLKLALAGVGCAAASLAVRGVDTPLAARLVISILAGGAAYVVLVLALRVFGAEDRRRIFSTLVRIIDRVRSR